MDRFEHSFQSEWDVTATASNCKVAVVSMLTYTKLPWLIFFGGVWFLPSSCCLAMFSLSLSLEEEKVANSGSVLVLVCVWLRARMMMRIRTTFPFNEYYNYWNSRFSVSADYFAKRLKDCRWVIIQSGVDLIAFYFSKTIPTN